MDLTLTPLQAEIRARARAVANEHLAPRAAEHDKAARFPAKQVKALAEADLLAMLVPKAFGGGEYGSVCYSLAMTEVARGCASSAVTMAVTNMVGDAIVAWGDEKAIWERVQAHWDAGASHVCIQPLRADGEAGPDVALLEAFAPAKNG